MILIDDESCRMCDISLIKVLLSAYLLETNIVKDRALNHLSYSRSTYN